VEAVTVGETGSHVSLAVTGRFSEAKETPPIGAHFFSYVSRQVTMGAVVSMTRTEEAQEAMLFEASLAAYVTVVSPKGYEPAAGPVVLTGEQLSHADAGAGATLAA
jgi:hypothetical protein